MGAEVSRADASRWSASFIASQLNEIGEVFSAYAQSIEANGINGVVLLTLKDDDLEDLGVTNKFHRKRLLAEIEQLKDEAEAGLQPAEEHNPCDCHSTAD